MTFNVKGLNDPKQIDRVRQYLEFVKPRPNIIIIQEHKLRNVRAHNLGSRLLKDASYFLNEEESGYNHRDGEPGAGCNGIATIISWKWEGLV